MPSSTLILTSSVPSTSHITQVSLQEPVPTSTKLKQFCNTAIQSVAIYNHLKQDTSVMSILHCIKLIKVVCLGFLYKQFENITNYLHVELIFLTPLCLLHYSRNSLTFTNIKEEMLGHVPYIPNNLTTNQGSPHKLQ